MIMRQDADSIMKFPENLQKNNMTIEWRERLAGRPVTIGILGPIGVGKSTLSAVLSEKLGLIHVEEKFPMNPFLAKFYEDPRRWSFKSQVWFLEQKINQLVNLDHGESHLLDPALEMDRIFAKTLARIGYMDEGEYKVYDDLFNTWVKEKKIKHPDLYIRMGASLPTLRLRIAKRGRPFEMNMLTNFPYYLSELNASVRDFSTSQKHADVIYVNATQDSFASPAGLSSLSEKIIRKLNE